MDGARTCCTGSTGALQRESWDDMDTGIPSSAGLKTQGDPLLGNPIAGDVFSDLGGLPNVVDLFDDYSHMDFG